MSETPRQFQPAADGFSRISHHYETFTAANPHLQWLRSRVYEHVVSVVPQGSHILEVNAGTGEDAVALIARGYRVHATDIAPQMIDYIEQKRASQPADALTSQLVSLTELDRVEGQFDALFSNSGGLNCIPDLTQFTRHLPSKLRTGGTATVAIMPPFYPWELTLMVKDWRVGTRRFVGQKGIAANVEGVQVMTYYYTPRFVMRCFGPRFSLVRLQSLNLFSPNADNYTFMQKAPRIYRALTTLDKRLGDLPPFNRWGDYFMLTMRFNG